MGWFQNLKVGTKLICIMLLVSLIPLSVVSIITFYKSKTIIEKSMHNLQDLYSDKKTSEIKEWFNNLEKNALISASTPSTFQSMNILKTVNGNLNSPQWKESVKQMETGFNTMIKEQNIPLLSILDPIGRVVYSSDSGIIGSDLADRDYFKKAMTGKISHSQFFYSDVVNQNCITINAPIFENGKNGKVVGVFSVLAIEKPINEITNSGIEEMGKSTNAYLIDENGLLLSAPRIGNKVQFKDKIDTTATRTLIPNIKSKSNFKGNGQYKDFLGKNVLGNYQVFTVGDTGVGLIFENETNEVFADVNSLRNLMISHASPQ